MTCRQTTDWTKISTSWIVSRRVLRPTHRVPTVRKSQGKQRGSGKSQGILKYHSLDQLFMHYFHNFCRLLAPRSSPGLRPKHCRSVYIAIFYNGTKFSITFVYLVLFYCVANKEISQGKLFILSGKVREKSGKMNSAK